MTVQPRQSNAVEDGLEGGLYLPPPPHISLYAEQHPSLSDLLVGDTVDLEITARVTDVDEEGRYGLELMSIKTTDKNGIREKAESEIIHLGSISNESLESLWGGK